MIKKLFVLGMGIMSLSSAWASGPGTTGADILSIPVGARAIGMGESYTAMADDVSSLYWNPAGIALLNQSQASFMYSKYFQDASLSQAAVATPLENGGIGASVSYLNYGTINGFNDTGDPTGNISAYSGVATLGGAWLGDFWSAGANLKGIQGKLADVSATGFGADLGLNLIYPHEVWTGGTLRFGATLRNLGSGMKYISEKDPLPTEWRAGVAAVQMLDRKLNLSLDYGKEKANKGSIYTGAEYWLMPILALRTGYVGNHTESNGLRLGMGLKVKNVSFDYAYSQYGDLGMDNRFELTVRFGAIQPRLTPEEREILRRGKKAMRNGRYAESVLLFDSLIQMEPLYKPARRLVKQAMKGNEQVDNLVKNSNNFKFSTAQSNSKPTESAAELEDLEGLLNLADRSDAAAALPTSSFQGANQ
jgi:hypothetical protein